MIVANTNSKSVETSTIGPVHYCCAKQTSAKLRAVFWRTARLSLTCRVTGGVRQNPSSSIVSAMAASLLSGYCRLFYNRKSADKPPICRGCNARVNCSSVPQMMSRSTFAGLSAHTSQEITMVASSMSWYAAGSGQLGSCSWAAAAGQGLQSRRQASIGSHLPKKLQLLLQNRLS